MSILIRPVPVGPRVGAGVGTPGTAAQLGNLKETMRVCQGAQPVLPINSVVNQKVQSGDVVCMEGWPSVSSSGD